MSTSQDPFIVSRLEGYERDPRYRSGDRLTADGWTAMAKDFAEKASHFTSYKSSTILEQLKETKLSVIILMFRLQVVLSTMLSTSTSERRLT